MGPQVRRIVLGIGLLIWAAAGICPTLAGQRESRLVAEWGGKGTGPAEFSPQAVFTTDRFGNLYVADTVLRRLQKIDPAGRVVWEAKAQGTALLKPLDVAVDGRGFVYVLDLGFFPLPSAASGRKAFFYAHCVRVFDPNGRYQATWNYLPLEKALVQPTRALKAIDAQGKAALLIPYGDLERPVRIAAAADGTLFVLDEELLYRIDSDGTAQGPFGGYGGADRGVDRPADFVVGDDGALYIADTDNDRIVVWDGEGNFLRAFGRAGTQDGELVRPFLVQVAPDGSLWVADEAVFTRVYETPLPQRREDPSPRPPETILPLRYRLSTHRLSTTLVRRIQRFSPEGRLIEKVLVRFPVESFESWHYRLWAIAPDGRLFYQHERTLRVRMYEPVQGIQWSHVIKTLQFRADLTTLDQQIDNPDLDAALGIDADYRARGVLFRNKALDPLVPRGTVGASAYGALRLAYDQNERERWLLHSGWYALESRSEQLYSVEAGLDPERSFPQDDRSTMSYNSAELRVEWERTLEQDPYRYRTLSAFAGIAFGRIRSLEKAIAAVNFRTFRVEQRFLDWEVGFEYDLSPKLYASFSLVRGPARGGFDGWWTYIDETGALFARGFNTGRETRIFWLLEGYL